MRLNTGLPLRGGRPAGRESKVSGSETRRLDKLVGCRVDAELHAAIQDRAESFGLSMSDYIRSIALSHKPIGCRTRSRFPTRAEKAFGELSKAITLHTAELNKHGSNLNQLTHIANAQEARGEVAHIDRAALDALWAAYVQHLAAAQEMSRAVFRITLLDTGGAEP